MNLNMIVAAVLVGLAARAPARAGLPGRSASPARPWCPAAPEAPSALKRGAIKPWTGWGGAACAERRLNFKFFGLGNASAEADYAARVVAMSQHMGRTG